MDLKRKKKEQMDYSFSVLMDNISRGKAETSEPQELDLLNKKLAAVIESYKENKIAWKKWLRR